MLVVLSYVYDIVIDSLSYYYCGQINQVTKHECLGEKVEIVDR